VFSGVVLALAIQLVLSMLGIGLGMTAVNPAQGINGLPQASSVGIGAGVWWTVAYIISLASGGYVAARLAGVVIRGDGLIHGLLTWAFALLISAYLVTATLGSVAGGAANAVGSVVSGIGRTATQAVPQLAQSAGIGPDALGQQLDDVMRPAGQQSSNQDARTQLIGALATIAAGGPQADQARQQATTLIAQQAGIPEDQAGQRLQQLEQSYNNAKQQATQTAGRVAQATSRTLSVAGIGGTIALVLGAIAAALGGLFGTRRARTTVLVD
jgi:hypothetical protein